MKMVMSVDRRLEVVQCSDRIYCFFSLLRGVVDVRWLVLGDVYARSISACMENRLLEDGHWGRAGWRVEIGTYNS